MQRFLRFIPLALLFAYLLKVAMVSASIADAIVILSLTCLTAFYEHSVKDRKYEELSKKILDSEENFKKYEEALKSLEGSISGVKLSLGIRSPNVKGK